MTLPKQLETPVFASCPPNEQVLSDCSKIFSTKVCDSIGDVVCDSVLMDHSMRISFSSLGVYETCSPSPYQ